MTEIKINDREVRKTLETLQKKLKNMKPVMSQIGEGAHDEIMENFEQEGRPKWRDLKPNTKKQRERKGWWPGKILNIHGSSGLLGSINYRATKDSAIIGTKKTYARALHYGEPSRNLPARPFLVLPDDFSSTVTAILREFLFKK